MRGGALASGPAVTDQRQGLAREHHGVFGVASVRWCGSHWRWTTTVGWRNGLIRRCFNDGEGIPVAGDGGDMVLQLEEEMRDEARSTAEGNDGRGWVLTEGGSRRWWRLHFR
jgi:hypothetical protein